MKSIIEQVLGESWHDLPRVLQRHYQAGETHETGTMAVRYPRWMQAVLNVLRLMGALVNQRGEMVHTEVRTVPTPGGQQWWRELTYSNGRQLHFRSLVKAGRGNHVIEFINPLLALEMAVWVREGRIEYEGVRYVMQLGRLALPVPEWLSLGHATIVEQIADDEHFDMDFRLTHPVFGEVFCYMGRFRVTPSA
ncbi:DUF4166 domain-containing protein [Burkholderiaceae bacterium DAT-1]|nr:DUF4166 domain-containing protein [Burkholderiaceae bacterium DAT-1]